MSAIHSALSAIYTPEHQQRMFVDAFVFAVSGLAMLRTPSAKLVEMLLTTYNAAVSAANTPAS
jgi:hypothetical protein